MFIVKVPKELHESCGRRNDDLIDVLNASDNIHGDYWLCTAEQYAAILRATKERSDQTTIVNRFVDNRVTPPKRAAIRMLQAGAQNDAHNVIQRCGEMLAEAQRTESLNATQIGQQIAKLQQAVDSVRDRLKPKPRPASHPIEEPDYYGERYDPNDDIC